MSHISINFHEPVTGSKWNIVAAIAVFLLILCCVQRYHHGLHRIPGPFWASISSFHRLISTARGNIQETHLAYHRKYGPVVRVGSSHVSFADPEALPVVYGVNTTFQKSNFYLPFDAVTAAGMLPTIFSIRDEAAHRALKRPVANAYSMATMIDMEPLTDECIKIFQNKMEVMQGRRIDLGTWLHWYSFDVITSITFSNRLGFMEAEEDVKGIISAIEGRLLYNSVIGQTPWLHKFLLGNSMVRRATKYIPGVARLNTSRYIVDFASEQLKRYQQKDDAATKYKDMLDRFKRWNGDGQETMSGPELLSHAVSNIFAGSDTTAISLRSMFYYLCKNPKCYAALRDEIDQMDERGELSEIVRFSESLRMPYLQACMKEAMRLHPAVGFLLERIVPSEGVTIKGQRIPGGTVIGANPWVVARDPDVYGADVDAFRPERWIDASTEALKLMDRNFLAFGTGSRTCIGRNVSWLEMSKLVPQILRLYTVELADPDAEWKIAAYWFVKQSNLFCKIRRR